MPNGSESFPTTVDNLPEGLPESEFDVENFDKLLTKIGLDPSLFEPTPEDESIFYKYVYPKTGLDFRSKDIKQRFYVTKGSDLQIEDSFISMSKELMEYREGTSRAVTMTDPMLILQRNSQIENRSEYQVYDIPEGSKSLFQKQNELSSSSHQAEADSLNKKVSAFVSKLALIVPEIANNRYDIEEMTLIYPTPKGFALALKPPLTKLGIKYSMIIPDEVANEDFRDRQYPPGRRANDGYN